jgi:sugar fermentation stimulation protein A
MKALDRGSYLVLLRLSRPRCISVGRLGRILFREGFYIYVGSALGGLSGRIARHRRLRKRPHWHIDRLRPHARFVEALAVRSSERLECDLALAIQRIASWSVPGFGCSDCRCESHLYGMAENPLDTESFRDLAARFGIDRPGRSP